MKTCAPPEGEGHCDSVRVAQLEELFELCERVTVMRDGRPTS